MKSLVLMTTALICSVEAMYGKGKIFVEWMDFKVSLL